MCIVYYSVTGNPKVISRGNNVPGCMRQKPRSATAASVMIPSYTKQMTVLESLHV